MRKDDFMFECMNYICDETILLSENRRKVRKQKRKKQSLPEVAAVAVVAVIFALGSALPIGISTGLLPDKESDIRYEEGDDVIGSMDEFTLDGKLYNIRNSLVEEQYVSDKITSISNKELDLKFDIYEIQSIASECAVAVRRNSDEEYYIYSNTDYKPETLGQLMDDLSLEENLVFEEIYLRIGDEEVLCEGYDEKEVYKLLFEENRDAIVTEKNIEVKKVALLFKIKKLDGVKAILRISNDEYIHIGMLEYEQVYPMGNMDKLIEELQ